VIAALGGGLAGALYFLSNLRISPDAAFGVNWTAYIIFIVVIGGIGTIEGPIIGTLLYFALRELFGDLGTWYLITLGLVAIVVMVKFPKGLWGYAMQRFDLRFFPVQRRLQFYKEETS
jgi:branched-chain amino acid transport system permease protein